MDRINRPGRYKKHFVCFDCRKGFKQPDDLDLAEKNGELQLLLNGYYYGNPKNRIPKEQVEYLKTTYVDRPSFCPECNQKMARVPMSFEVPSKKAVKQWEMIHSYYRALGFVSNQVPDNRKALMILMTASLQWHLKTIQSEKAIKEYYYIPVADAKSRLQKNIKNIEAELIWLKSIK